MNRSSALKNFIKKYKHAWVFLYAFIYMPWFMYLEKHITADSEYHVIHSVLDDKIPFVEYFIVPYLLWFVFITAVFLYFFFTDVEGFYKLAKLSFIGMTIFLLISTVFPNGLTLRPVVFPRDNIFLILIVFVQVLSIVSILPFYLVSFPLLSYFVFVLTFLRIVHVPS